jgi:hypothetical protein
METVWKQLSSELFPLFPAGRVRNAVLRGKKFLKIFKMETVWKQFRIQLRGVSMRPTPRALLGEKCSRTK